MALRDEESDADDDQDQKKDLDSLEAVVFLAVFFVATKMHGIRFYRFSVEARDPTNDR